MIVLFVINSGNVQLNKEAKQKEKLEYLSLEEQELLAQGNDFCVQNVKVEFVSNPVGLDLQNPSFSWEMYSEKENVKQYAYRIQVYEQTGAEEEDRTVWDSGFVQSDDAVEVVYQGESLQSHKMYGYTVTCVDENMKFAVSDMGFMQMAYVDEAPFEQAKMLSMQGEENVYYEGQAIFVKEFEAGEKPLKKATIYATALGIYDAYINGQRVGNDELKPGWSNYHKSLYYNTYDITKLLVDNHNAGAEEGTQNSIVDTTENPSGDVSSEELPIGELPTGEVLGRENLGGENRIAVMLGTGWWCGRVAFGTYDYHKPAFVATIRLEYEDGSVEEIYTDESWKYIKDTAVVSADIFNGEVYDGSKLTTKEVSELEKEALGTLNWKDVVINTDFIGDYHSFYGYQVKNVEKYDQKPVSAMIYNTVVDNGTTYGALSYEEASTSKEDLEVQQDNTQQIQETKQGEVPAQVEEQSAKSQVAEVYGKIVPLASGDDWCLRLKKGETLILDMGQNMTGVPYLKYSAKKGTEITVDFAEMLNDTGRKKRGNDGAAGSLYTANYRSAVSDLTLIAGEDEIEEYQPVFTYYGFRYLSIVATEDVVIHDVKGKFIGNSSPETGYVKTDNELLNKLFENVTWTQRNNFLLVATDCPQRDERIGWSGDLQVFAKTSMYNQELASFYHKWFRDVVDSQTEEGAYTDTVPATITTGAGNAGWGDAGISIPYDYYMMYGDSKQLLTSYPSMTKYMDYLESISNFDLEAGRIGPSTSFGDWLGIEDSDKELISTLYYAKDAMQMAEISCILGKNQNAKQYEKLYDRIKTYFTQKYMSDGQIKEEYRTQTVLVLAMAYDMLSLEEKEVALGQLLGKIDENGGTLSTGFLGTPMILKVLSENGKLEKAYSLLLQEKNPSWIYSILQGATTIWERYDSYTLEHGFADVAMNSFNHFNNGSVVMWMYENMLGIQMVQEEGYDVLLCPGIVLDNESAPIHQVEGSYQSVFGEIKASFDITEKEVVYQVNIPANCQVKLQLPVYDNSEDDDVKLKESQEQSQKQNAEGLVGGKSNEKKGQQICKEWSLGSGTYTFAYSRTENVWVMTN